MTPNNDEKIKEKEMIKEKNKEVKSLKQYIENLGGVNKDFITGVL